MKKHIHITSLCLIVLVGACGGESMHSELSTDSALVPSQAQSFPQSAREQLASLAARANYICHARVRVVTSRREQYLPNVEMVMSRIELEILTNWKGDLRSGVEIRSFGGRLEGTPYFAAPFPEFVEGEDVVLFLADFVGGIFPVNHKVGVMRVESDEVLTTGLTLEEFGTIVDVPHE